MENEKEKAIEKAYGENIKHTILNLKKKVLVFESEFTDIEEQINSTHFDGKPIKYICKGSELTEEIASSFFYETNFDSIGLSLKMFDNFIFSNGFHWLENPFQDDWDEVCTFGHGDFSKNGKTSMQLYFQAEEKTFKNPLIFEML